jgi:hypothetical protein
MTAEQQHTVILSQLDIIAESRYPNEPALQAQFKIGFLTAQLARTWSADSQHYAQFKMTVNQLGFTQTTTKR